MRRFFNQRGIATFCVPFHIQRCAIHGSSRYKNERVPLKSINIKSKIHMTANIPTMMAKVLKSAIPYKPPTTENLIKFIKDGLRKNSKQTIIIDSATSKEWTGEKIESAISEIAKFLIEQCDLKKGDVCSIYDSECDQVAIIILTIMCSGGVVNFFSSKSSGREVHDAAVAMNSKILISRDKLLKKIRPELADIESKIQVVSFDDCEPCCAFKNGCKTIAHLFSDDRQPDGLTLDHLVDSVHINPESDYGVIQFSSGTTGKPKPIPRTHKNLCHLVASVDHEELMNLKPSDVITGSLPLSHRPGLWALLASVECGNAYVIWSNWSDVDDALATIEKFKVTIFSSSLPLLSMLGNQGIKLKEKYNTLSLQHIITSGAKIVNPDLPTSLVKVFNLKSLRQCFGMTESGWCFLIEQSQAKGNYLSVGHVVPGMEAIVVDRKTNEKLEPYARGEIALRGPQVFPGYLTSEPGVLNRSDFIEGGWFKIGDQAYYDKDNKFFIEGRYKEVMMFENNYMFFPSEIEAVISEHRSIEGVCVVKIKQVNEDFPYDIARAFVTLKHGVNFDESELLEFVSNKLPNVILTGGIKKLEKFPRMQNGKVDKQILSTWTS